MKLIQHVTEIITLLLLPGSCIAYVYGSITNPESEPTYLRYITRSWTVGAFVLVVLAIVGFYQGKLLIGVSAIIGLLIVVAFLARHHNQNYMEGDDGPDGEDDEMEADYAETEAGR
jgi:hypothetical protein